jgi:hypothetical protein
VEVILSIASVFLAFYIIAKLFRPLLLALERALDRWLIWKQIRDNQRRYPW